METRELEKINQAKVYLFNIVKELVEQSDLIKIEGYVDVYGVNLVITASVKDTRTLIGKQGYFSEALRKIMKQWGYNNGATVNAVVKPNALNEQK